jgi:hypothetical protein
MSKHHVYTRLQKVVTHVDKHYHRYESIHHKVSKRFQDNIKLMKTKRWMQYAMKKVSTNKH